MPEGLERSRSHKPAEEEVSMATLEAGTTPKTLTICYLATLNEMSAPDALSIKVIPQKLELPLNFLATP